VNIPVYQLAQQKEEKPFAPARSQKKRQVKTQKDPHVCTSWHAMGIKFMTSNPNTLKQADTSEGGHPTS
jgi:hypothetical protein